MELERRENETEFQHHKRIVEGKLVDKTLADYDYAELAPYAYGKEYSTDVARRLFYGSRDTLALLEKDQASGVQNEPSVSALDSKINEYKKERQKFLDQRREYNKLVTTNARQEYLDEALIAAANNLTSTVGRIYKDEEPRAFIPRSDREAVLVFSDWHYGMTTSNIFNIYDTNVCKARVKTVVRRAVDRIIENGCEKLHIVVLGDLIHGHIHTTARVASEELTCDQLMQVSEILAQSIEELANFVEETDVYVTYGNHARTVANKNDSIHRDNMERIVPWWLRQRLASRDDITIMPESDDEFLLVKTCGGNFVCSHGDLDNTHSGKLLYTLFGKKLGETIDYVLIGDKHHRESFNELDIDAMLCGSLCGVDDYANEKRLYSAPSQLLLIVKPGYGVDAEYRLKTE